MKRNPCAPAALFAAALLVAPGGCGGSDARIKNDVGERNITVEKGGTAPRLSRDAREEAPAVESLGGNRYAVVVGISKYADSEIPSLQYARSDAEKVCAFFLDEAGLAIPPQNVRLLVDKEATRDALQAKLSELNDRAKPLDSVIVFFAGHGAVDIGEKGEVRGNYLLPHDTRAVKRGEATMFDPASALAIADLFKILQVNKARNVLVLLDACFSGGGKTSLSRVVLDANQARQSSDEFKALSQAAVGRAVLTATEPNQPALEVDELQGGLFTHYLLEGLGADGNRDGKVTVGEAYDHLFEKVSAAARERGREQRPTKNESATGVEAIRVLPSTTYRVGLKVDYHDGRAPIEATRAAPPQPAVARDPKMYSLAVDVWDAPAPLHAYVFRFSLTRGGAGSERLIPDGENLFAPRVTIAEGRNAVYPDPEEFGARTVAVRSSERDAEVVFVLIASASPIPMRTLDRLENGARALGLGASGQPAAAFVRRLAAFFEAEPELKEVALKFAWVRHGRGGTPGAAGTMETRSSGAAADGQRKEAR